ncbi:MAG: hypothetical protein IJ237_09965, partial [Oscillospiraceae bacterium]|nr:hypothetical protein [Oscillospiraceae bacterium]
RNRAAILVCWYLLKAGEKELTPKELESFTSEKLPRYMVPAYWVQLDFFPKNINGKVDRKALPEPDFDRFSLMEPPQDYLEEKFLEIAQRMMPDIRFGVTDDLLSLGMDSILAVQYVSEVEKYDPRITVSDVLRLKNIREILTAPKTIGWFYKEYDAAKPIIVLIHGIVPVSGFSRLCALWEESFNLFVIEPFPDHIMQEVGRYDYDALIACYTELLKRELPEQAILWGFAGFSFGGQLAVSMADAWQKRTGEQKTVLMGDTLMHWIYPGKTFHRLTEDDPYIRMVTERGKKYGDSAVNEPLEITLKKQNAVIDLLNTVHENIKYEGPVWYLDAKMDYDDPTEQIKLAVVQSLYPKLRLFHFPKLFHNDLYLLNDEMIRFYQNLFLSEGVNPEYI